MTIEEKAKAYDEALENAKYYHDAMEGDVCCVLEECFPQLKESEDERIRKELIFYFQEEIHQCSIQEHADKMKEWIAWLEKQGEQKHKIQPKFKIGDIIRFKGNETLKGEVEAHKIVGYDNELYVFADGTTDLFCEQDLYELVEQKSADKVESKFWIQKGKWYVCTKNLLDNYGNTAFSEGYTYLSTQDGSLIASNSNIPYKVTCPDVYFRDWNIKDANNGSVLYSKEHNLLWLHKDSKQCHFCINLNYSNNISIYSDIVIPKDAYPATKEQREFLFAKLKEIGYKWDAEKKELKKIELQPYQWNISDFRTWQYIVSDVLTKHDGIGQYLDDGFCKKIAQYMQNEWSKKLCSVQNFNTWSKEDEEMLNKALAVINKLCAARREYVWSISTLDKLFYWLKSLKDRYTWKPSDEQMQELHNVFNDISGGWEDSVIESLYQDLKKLREE